MRPLRGIHFFFLIYVSLWKRNTGFIILDKLNHKTATDLKPFDIFGLCDAPQLLL